MSRKSKTSRLDENYSRTSNAFDFPCTEDSEGCRTWYMATNEYAHVQPGSIGFNGHQAVFHGYRLGENYTPRSGKTDKCTLKLSSLPKGTQMCTILYENPTPLKIIEEPEPVCTVDRQVETDYDELYSEKPNKIKKDQAKGNKISKGNKKGEKK